MGNTVINLPLESVTISKTNPRKHFDPEQLTELADSIKTHGVLQPILVRPNGDKFQLVVGERRFRASKEAKVKTIPAITKALTDEEAFELGMIENLQRQDLTEIEEAKGYRYMLDKFGYKAEDLAEKINKSRAYIYGRLKLVSLCGKGQKALDKGEISASIGLLIARIPGKAQQDKALEEILEGDNWNEDGAMTFRASKEHIEENYMIRLKGCGFSTKDEKLLPKAGPCTTCPKRTGNQKDLYPNTSADVCTDPECFRAKVETNQAILIEKAKAQGKEVLAGKEAEKHISYGRLSHNSSLLELKKQCYEDGKTRSYQELLGKDCPEITLVQTEDGLLPTVNKKEAEAVLKKKFKWARQSGNRDQKWKDEQKRETAKRKIQAQVFKESLAQIADNARSTKVTDKFWLFIAKTLAHNWYTSDNLQALIKRREIPYTMAKDAWDMKWGKFLLDYLETAKGSEVRSIVVELVVSREGHRDWNGKLHDSFKDACTMFGIDSAQIEKDVKREAKAKETAKAKKKTAKKKATKKKTKLEPVNLAKLAS